MTSLQSVQVPVGRRPDQTRDREDKSLKEPSFSIGIEEEYLLIDRETRDLVSDPDPSLLSQCQRELGEQVSPEFLQAQIEVGTRVCKSMAEVRDELIRLRSTVQNEAHRHGYGIIAASTHPFAHWDEQKTTDKERYRALAHDMQVAARRMLICGMHVHVGIEDDALRIDLMNQARYFLPHVLALSASSPFWQGSNTGMHSYRLSVFDQLPRTGLPAQFESFEEYTRTIDVLIHAGVLEDTTKVWWDLRPSARFPTLEMRISDLCPLLEDTVALAALFRCLLRFLYRLRVKNQRWRSYPLFLLDENRWRAQRYGISEGLLDYGRGEIVDFGTLVDELIELVAEDSAHFGCEDEIAHLKTILTRGTSAMRQIACFEQAVAAGRDHANALNDVVDLIHTETLACLDS